MIRDEQDHKTLALWAADCAERVLSLFESIHPEHLRPVVFPAENR